MNEKFILIVFSYSRFAGLLMILASAIKNKKFLSKIIVISNGEIPSDSWIDKFEKDVEVIFIVKRGSFDQSFKMITELIKNSSEYVYLCGDDDMPNFSLISGYIDYARKYDSIKLIGANPPARRILDKMVNDNSSDVLLNDIINKPLSYPKFIKYFIFSLPLNSFISKCDLLLSVDSDYIDATIGTWHAYSLVFMRAMANRYLENPNLKEFIFLNSNKRLVESNPFEWSKDYKIDEDMMDSLRKTLNLIPLFGFTNNEAIDFKELFTNEIEDWYRKSLRTISPLI